MLITPKTKKQLDKLIILPAIVFIVQSVPWITARIRLRMVAPLMLMYVVLSLVHLDRRFTQQREIRAARWSLIGFVLYSAVYILLQWRYYGSFFNQVFVAHVFGLFSLWVFIALATENKVKEIKVLVMVVLGALLVAALMGGLYLGDEINKDIIRAMTAGEGANADVAEAHLSGVGGYGTVYSLGLLVPALFYSATQIKNLYLKLFVCVTGLASFVYVLRAGFSIIVAVIFISLLFYIGAFLFKNQKIHLLMQWIIIALLLFTTLNPQVLKIFASPLTTIVGIIDNPNYTARLTSILDVTSGISGDDYALNRTGLMWVSWRAFLSSPIYGVQYGVGAIGGHSFIFDYLAQGGLLYFMVLPLCVYLYFQYMKIAVFRLSRRVRGLIVSYSMSVLLVCLLNPLNSSVVYNTLFFLLPGLTLFYKNSLLGKQTRMGPAL